MAVHRHDVADNQCAFWSSFGSLLHGGFRIATRILTACPTAQTKVWTYTFPAALYDLQNQPRTWVDYGNPFEDYALNDLPRLNSTTGQPIIDYPSTGRRYWVDMLQIDPAEVAKQLIPKLNQLLHRRIADDSVLLQLLRDFGTSSSPSDLDRNGVVDDADLLRLLMCFGQPFITQPPNFDGLFEGYFIDNAPEYHRYWTQYAGRTPQQALEGYERFVQLLKIVSPTAKICANVYEGAVLDTWNGFLDVVDVVFFENWRWHWATGTPLSDSAIQTIERRIRRCLSAGKSVVLGVPHALDSADGNQKKEAVRTALQRWGDGVVFAEYRKSFYRGREVGYPRPVRELF
jgi:hypothetical protein